MAYSNRKIVSWDRNVPDRKHIQVKQIEHFDARGLMPLYGRGDHFPSHGAYHMDIWTDRKGRVLARFWSRRLDVDGTSYEVIGMESFVKSASKKFDEDFVPAKLRTEYDDWIRCFL